MKDELKTEVALSLLFSWQHMFRSALEAGNASRVTFDAALMFALLHLDKDTDLAEIESFDVAVEATALNQSWVTYRYFLEMLWLVRPNEVKELAQEIIDRVGLLNIKGTLRKEMEAYAEGHSIQTMFNDKFKEHYRARITRQTPEVNECMTRVYNLIADMSYNSLIYEETGQFSHINNYSDDDIFPRMLVYWASPHPKLLIRHMLESEFQTITSIFRLSDDYNLTSAFDEFFYATKVDYVEYGTIGQGKELIYL